MIENLIILNGSMKETFNPEIYEYDVTIDSTVFSLELSYTSSGEVTIYGNDYLTDGEGHVLIEVLKDNHVTTYTLNIFKESTEAFAGNNSAEKLEISIKNQVFEDIKMPLISIICFLAILTLYCIIFRKKKKC